MTKPAAIPRTWKSAAHWFAEGLLILLSVAVGFGAAAWGEQRRERALAADVLTAVREEVEHNLAALDPLLAKHRNWQQALARPKASDASKSAYDVLFESRPDGETTIGVPLRSAAWSTAVSSGALRLLDYPVVAALAEIYSYQQLMTDNHNRFVSATLYAPSTFDPAARVVSSRLLWGVISEIAGNEEALRDLYRKHLPVLRKASGPVM